MLDSKFWNNLWRRGDLRFRGAAFIAHCPRAVESTPSRARARVSYGEHLQLRAGIFTLGVTLRSTIQLFVYNNINLCLTGRPALNKIYKSVTTPQSRELACVCIINKTIPRTFSKSYTTSGKITLPDFPRESECQGECILRKYKAQFPQKLICHLYRQEVTQYLWATSLMLFAWPRGVENFWINGSRHIKCNFVL